MPDWWQSRPQVEEWEAPLLLDFYRLAAACGGDVRLRDVLAWLDLRDEPEATRRWMVEFYAALAVAWRAPPQVESQPDG